MLSFRFRAMYQNLGLTRPDLAKLLHVTERTLHNWDTGHHEIPYSAYRLLRLLTRQELPGKAWAGWHVTAGVLWSPEGHGFKPQDSNWWSMLCRRAAQFHALYEENSRLRHAAQSAAQRAVLVDVPVTRHFSLMDETFTQKTGIVHRPDLDETGRQKCPAETRLMRVHFAQTMLKGGV